MLYRMNIHSKERKEIPIPNPYQMESITQNPQNPDQVAILTMKKHIYISSNHGANWKKFKRGSIYQSIQD